MRHLPVIRDMPKPIVGFLCSFTVWFWCIFADVVLASIKAPTTFVIGALLDYTSALSVILNLWQPFRRFKKRMVGRIKALLQKKNSSLTTQSRRMTRNLSVGSDPETGFSATFFVLKQTGEISVGACLYLLLVALRYGPAKDSYIVASVPNDRFRKFSIYYFILVGGELLFTLISAAIVTRKFRVNLFLWVHDFVKTPFQFIMLFHGSGCVLLPMMVFLSVGSSLQSQLL